MFTPEALNTIATNGPFAVIFVGYLVWQSKENRRREERLMAFVESVAPVLQGVRDDLHRIAGQVEGVQKIVTFCEDRQANYRGTRLPGEGR
jgi:hypothetical protein